MASTRYGRILHGSTELDIRFPSADERQRFTEEFTEYHDGHDHDGEVPTFENISAGEANKSFTLRTYGKDRFTIDGYHAYEILEYHEGKKDFTRYSPPTCCVPPIIALNRGHSDLRHADKFRRHELSAIFGDMPKVDFESLLESVERDGFIDNVIRVYDGKVLDGWHRYRAARELNLLRKLRFKVWHEDEHQDGDPIAFVYGRNQHRRHYSAAQRAQVAVAFNKRFGHGGDRKSDESRHQNGVLKTKRELAEEANVGTSTIDRAIAVEKAGGSEAVIAGEKTAGEVLKAREAEQRLKRKKKKLKAMWDARIQASRDYIADENAELVEYLELTGLEDGFARYHETLEDAFKSGIARYESAKGDFARFQESAQDVSLEDVEKECKAISIYAYDIANYKAAEWIQKMIEWKKDALAEAAKPKPKPAPEPDLKTLRKQVKAEMPLWKQRDKEQCQYESDHIGKASFSMLVSALRNSINYVVDEKTGEIPEGEATAAELKELLRLMKSDNFSLILAVRRHLKEASEEDTVDSLWERITPAISAWKAARKGTGVGHASKTMFISAIKCFDSELSRDSETDVVLLKKLLDIVTEIHGPVSTFERYIKMQCDGASIWEDSESHDTSIENEDLSDWDAAHRYANSVIDAFRNILRGLHVVDVDEFLDEILHFFEGIAYADVRVATEAHLKSIVDLFQPLLTQEVADWPEFIRNHHWIPKRELVLVSIGISNNTDDAFEMVEFTDENSDEIQVELNDIPEHLRDALFNIAVEKIYANEMHELSAEGED